MEEEKNITNVAENSELTVEEVQPVEPAAEETTAPKPARRINSLRKGNVALSDSVASEILLLGVVLMAITAIVAGILGFVHSQTAPRIQEHETQKREAALSSIFPEADEFVDAMTKTTENFKFQNSDIESVYLVYQKGEIVGYCVNLRCLGYSSTPMELMVGSDLLNKVTAIQVVNHSETPGIGAEVLSDSESFLGQFTGQSRPIEYSSQITAVSGATVTSDAVKDGVNLALSAVDEVRLNMAQGKEGK